MTDSAPERLARQVGFILEIDKLKRIVRRTYLTDRTRRENDAEHSWHLAVMAMLLSEYATEASLDVPKVIKLVLVHDLVEIDAGDTFCYDEAAHADKAEREQAAADRIFDLLPPDQGSELRALWEEFEARRTGEARFAAAMDRLQPLLHNYHTQGLAWREHGVTADRVLARNRHMAEGAPALWDYAERFIRDAVERGYLAPPQKHPDR
ncbi:MAG: HD domain-containing protein [Planctomycetota bacterium]